MKAFALALPGYWFMLREFLWYWCHAGIEVQGHCLCVSHFKLYEEELCSYRTRMLVSRTGAAEFQALSYGEASQSHYHSAHPPVTASLSSCIILLTLKISEYNDIIEHVAETTNVVTDFLSDTPQGQELDIAKFI